jgi:OPA family glycerol-3-phosphate transporter-like MFS transporter
MPAHDQARFDRAQTYVMWVLWLTYGAFYFCRNNLSAAVPGMQEELGLSKAAIGGILGALKISYGVGQLINGQLAERIGARRLLAIGMLASAGLNVVFGFATGFYFLLFLWACNGYFQALGWAPTMRVAAAWFPPTMRGRAISVIGTGYQLTGSLTFVVAGWSAEWLGWRGALYVPALLLAGTAIIMLATLREEPAAGLAAPGTTPRSIEPERTWLATLGLTLSNPKLWLLAIPLGLLNACRYGFIDWGITHLLEVQAGSVGVAALKYSVLPLGGIVGTLAAGWATDRFFDGRRVPVVCGMLVMLGLLTLGYNSLVHTNQVLSIVTLGLIGAMVFGPQVLLVGTAPVDLARSGTSAAAVGFVNFFGYLGAAAGDQITGYLVDAYDWHAALHFWAGCAFGAAVIAAPLWRAIAEYRRT